MLALRRVGGPRRASMSMAVELLTAAKMVASPVGLVGARAKRHLALCSLASMTVG